MSTLVGNIISGVVFSTIRSINVSALPRAKEQDDLNVIHCLSDIGKSRGKEITGYLHIWGLFHVSSFHEQFY